MHLLSDSFSSTNKTRKKRRRRREEKYLRLLRFFVVLFPSFQASPGDRDDSYGIDLRDALSGVLRIFAKICTLLRVYQETVHKQG
jgi:hypothetical protein